MPPYLQLSNEPSLLLQQQPLHPDVLHVNIPVINQNHYCGDHHDDHDAVAKNVFLESSPGFRFPLTPIPEGIVRFQLPESKDIHLVPNREQCQKEDKKQNTRWYSKDELERIKQENRRLLRGYQRKTISSKDFCLRGLENMTGGGTDRWTTNRLSCLFVVFEEQRRQYRNGIFNPELIASIASSTTRHCQEVAISLGIDDWIQCQDEEQQVPALLATGSGVEEDGMTDFCLFLLNPLKGFIRTIDGRHRK